MNSIQKLLAGQMGWKTVTAVLVLALLTVALQMQWITPDQFEKLRTLAEAFGIYGIRDALAKPPGTG